MRSLRRWTGRVPGDTYRGGSVRISTNDLKALLRYYKIVDPARTDELINLGKAARDRTWWSDYREKAPSGLLQLIGYESAASARRNFEALLIPGLLQTEDYARAIIPALDEEISPERVNTLVELRMRRQELVHGTTSPQLYFVLDEAAIRHQTGGPAVMRGQLQHLMKMPNGPTSRSK